MRVLCIKGGTIINEGRSARGDILIEDDEIRSVSFIEPSSLPAGAGIINAEGLLVIPGVIDDQVHFREPGLTHKGSIASESAAAAAGGITSFMDMPNTLPPTTTKKLLREKLEIAARSSVINYAFYLGATNDNISDILSCNPDIYCGIKVFMGSSTGNMLVDSETALREIFRNTKVPVACHCEEESIIRKNTAEAVSRYGDNIPPGMHPAIRSREACYASSSKAVSLAEEYGTRLHILHLSTADEMQLFENSLPVGEKTITAEVCVHHLWFDDSHYPEKGNFIKWNPAIKTAFDRRALLNAVNNDLIDIIATDHAPHTIEEKSKPYIQAPSGGPLVQHSLVAMMELAHQGLISREKIISKMCHNPAIIFGIEGRGFLREGYKADVCILDPDNPWQVDSNNILSRCGWSPFTGTTFRTRVHTTIVNGNIVYCDGKVNNSIRGKQLRFTRK